MADWSFWTPAEPIEPEGVLIKGERKRLIHGIAATEAKDLQGEELILSGMDFKPYLESGHLNDDHMPGEQHILGKPVEAKIILDAGKVKKGMKGPAFYHVCELFDSEPGRAAWDNIRAERNDPKRQRGFSVEGAVTEAARNRLTKTRCDDVALTRKPANVETFAQLVKSLSTGTAPALQLQYVDETNHQKEPKRRSQASTSRRSCGVIAHTTVTTNTVDSAKARKAPIFIWSSVMAWMKTRLCIL